MTRSIYAAAMLAVATAVPARADTAAPEDEKYRKAFDAAVDRGLSYLAAAQGKDGSFPGGMPKNTAIASLCAMAFLARGYLPGLPPHGDVIDRSIEFVISAQAPDGNLIGAGAGGMYSHNISALMLSEVSGMLDPARQTRVREALGRALKVTLDAQNVKKAENQQGGWRYAASSSDSDISHSGWALMALRSARNNGAAVPREAIDDAAKFILRCRNADGGFGYQPGGASGVARAGAGLLCLELSGRHRDEVTLGAGKFIQDKLRSAGWGGEMAYYGSYYCAQGMFQLGGEEWEAFSPWFYDTVLKLQQADGAWPVVPGAWDAEASPGACYRTAMAVLALSVSYRQLPIYQR